MILLYLRRRIGFLNKKDNKLTCTDNLMIKLPTAILLLAKVSEPLVSSHELNLDEIFLVLLVIYFALNLSTMLEFCGMGTRLKIKKKQKNMFQDLRQRTPMETFHFKDARSTSRK